MKSPFWLVIVLGIVLVGGILFYARRVAPQEGTDLEIVTTITPITQLVQPIVGDLVGVKQIIPLGQEIHDFQATPSTLRSIANADLVVANGGGLEDSWLDPILAENPTVTVVNFEDLLATDGIELIKAGTEDEGSATNLQIDPHFWLSPKNTLLLADAVREALINKDESNSLIYSHNAAQLKADLTKLDQEITAAVSEFARTEFIGFHNAFAYFARDYDLTQVGSFEPTPGEAPTPGQLAEIEALVNTYGLKGLYNETQFSSAIVDQFAADHDLIVRPLDPIEVAVIGDDYFSIMRRNLGALTEVQTAQ